MMPISLDDFEKLRGEVNQIFLADDHLLVEDDFLLHSLLQVKNPKSILDLVRELKEEGNSLFRNKHFDDALERYGYAGLLLGHNDFRDDEDRARGFDLAISILLNTAACLNKRKEFVQVGKICTIILDFDSKNVKAMFRRALAAIELGRGDLAYWDLLMAAEVEPGNRDIIEKLEEVKKTHLNRHNFQSQDDIPKGLGSGHSPLKKVKVSKEAKNVLDKDRKLEKGEDTPKEDDNCEHNSMLVEQDESQGSSNVEDMELQGNLHFKQESELSEKARGADVKVEVICASSCNSKDVNLAEPKYRFDNRRRPGFSISISKKDYQAMMEGKSIQYCNSKIGSLMSIRVLPSRKGDENMQITNQDVEKMEPNKVDNEVGNRETAREETIPIEPQGQAMDSEAKCNTRDLRVGELGNSCIWFTAHNKQQWKFELRKRIQKRVLRWKAEAAAKKQETNNKVLSASTTADCVVVCRQAGMKRKSLALLQEAFRHPRKKALLESYRNVASCDLYSTISSESCRKFELCSTLSKGHVLGCSRIDFASSISM